MLEKDADNWGVWGPHVENNDAALDMIRNNVNALRRGEGRLFLVYGRMLRPVTVEGIATVTRKYKGIENAILSVFHAAWQSPDGRIGIVLENWTDKEQKVIVYEKRLCAR